MLMKYFTKEWYLNKSDLLNDHTFQEEHDHWLKIKPYFPEGFPYTKSSVHDLKLEKVDHENQNVIFEFNSNGALSEIAKLTFIHAQLDDPEHITDLPFKMIDCLYEEYSLSDLKEYRYYMGILAINPFKTQTNGAPVPFNMGIYFDDMQVLLKPKQFYYDSIRQRIRNK